MHPSQLPEFHHPRRRGRSSHHRSERSQGSKPVRLLAGRQLGLGRHLGVGRRPPGRQLRSRISRRPDHRQLRRQAPLSTSRTRARRSATRLRCRASRTTGKARPSITDKKVESALAPDAGHDQGKSQAAELGPRRTSMNPLGVRAMYLGASMYRIHGTDAPWTIGQAVSKGCIRMYNKDVLDLYPRVPVGTKVTVTWNRYSDKSSVVANSSDAAAPSDVTPENAEYRGARTRAPRTGFAICPRCRASRRPTSPRRRGCPTISSSSTRTEPGSGLQRSPRPRPRTKSLSRSTLPKRPSRRARSRPACRSRSLLSPANRIPPRNPMPRARQLRPASPIRRAR